MARLMSAMDTHLSVSTLAGTPGTSPARVLPELPVHHHLAAMYSYGVVLLELLTGEVHRPSDFGDNNLVGWVKQHSKLKISGVFDQELLSHDPTLELELLEHLKIACACWTTGHLTSHDG
ncbi:hypothetical protein HPP92_022642 [Vanilla planifolia]|uniref:Uncharacterized protein n=1 Tax=Vanilla planifolia TaxID=51239 RepID=A0A835PXG7_VANPL|nr:hypothetical protein HPP92_022924 [Vanilla planifolia]KAG0459514.1 hypothetical protein HPP92_022642 [Vanilla planifolia]